jgi:hypothetical protein
MLRISYKNVAFPLMFRMLDKRGNPNTSERIALIQDFINWFGKDCIDGLLEDRVLASTLTIVLIHWLVSDIGVWYQNPAYTQDLAGFWACLVKAIPFEIRFLEGTVIYGALLFGALKF